MQSLKQTHHSPICRRSLLVTASIFMLSISLPSLAFACGCTGAADSGVAKSTVSGKAQSIIESPIKNLTTQLFEQYIGPNGSHRKFISETLYQQRVLPALQDFTKQMSAIAMHQAYMIGTFFDAQNQLQTQRLYQELQVQAHKDYQPSQDFCTFGTNVRSLAASETISRFNTLALNNRQMKRHLGNKYSEAAESRNSDLSSRWQQFTTTYCNKQDNGWDKDEPDKTGLAPFCTSTDPKRHNIDIDYTRLVENPRTIDVSFYDDSGTNETEQDIMALSSNLFGHLPIVRPSDLSSFDAQKKYFSYRSLASKRNVAESSFNAIVGLKASGSSKADQAKTREFMAAIMQELGYTYDSDPKKDEIYKTIGENPSYYAQLEILAKKIYQNPDFFAGLYDKPANVARKSVAMKAIELMLDRAIYESQTRQEMTLSVLLSTQLNNDFTTVSTKLGTNQ